MGKTSTVFKFSSMEMMIFGELVPQRVAQWRSQRMLSQTSLASGDETSFVICQEAFPDLVVLSDSAKGPWTDHVDTLFRLRDEGYGGRAVVITESPSYDALKYALNNQISDYLVPGPFINIDMELERLITTPIVVSIPRSPETIRRMGLFRSFGLTSGQMDLIVAFASNFSRLGELADRLGQTEGQLRKTISRVYDKLRGPLSIDCPARLAHVLTLCLQAP